MYSQILLALLSLTPTSAPGPAEPASAACWPALSAPPEPLTRVHTLEFYEVLAERRFPHALVPLEGEEQLTRRWHGRFYDEQGRLYTSGQVESLLAAAPPSADLAEAARIARTPAPRVGFGVGSEHLPCNASPGSEACKVYKARQALVWGGGVYSGVDLGAALTLMTASKAAKAEADRGVELKRAERRQYRQRHRAQHSGEDELLMEALCAYNADIQQPASE